MIGRTSLGVQKWIISAFIFLLAAPCFADYDLGTATLSRKSAPALRTSGSLRSVLGSRPSRGFLRRVGGVAFDAKAKPVDGLTVDELKLRYEANQEDGKRVRIILNGQTLLAEIYDWQLIPIVKFADSQDVSCFTLYGELSDKTEESELRREGARFMNYCDAFEDTLLGLRLMQLDLLRVSDEFAVNLPSENGKYMLGNGEATPDIERNRRMLSKYIAAYQKIEDELEQHESDYTTYVICDIDQEIEFSGESGRLKITGQPYYYFANTNINELVMKVAKELDIVGDNASESDLETALSKLSSSEELTDLIKLSRLTNAYNDLMESEELKYGYAKSLSEKHATIAQMLGNVNPQVWDAGVKTMRFAAFFRYCKQTHPDEWRKFAARIEELDLSTCQPNVQTPTVMQISPDN